MTGFINTRIFAYITIRAISRCIRNCNKYHKLKSAKYTLYIFNALPITSKL